MRSLIADLVLVRLQKETDPLLHKRLYKAIRHAILDGSLPPHSRLPPSRDLAGELRISRNTILTVYEQLLAEGYVVSRRGSGTFVAKTLPDMFLPASSASESSILYRFFTRNRDAARVMLLMTRRPSRRIWGMASKPPLKRVI